MEKNPDKNFTTVEVDPATDEYCVKIPEWIMNEMGWYEGTDVQWIIDGDEIFLREVSNDQSIGEDVSHICKGCMFIFWIGQRGVSEDLE